MSAEVYARVLDLLREEERLLGELVGLALEKQRALIASDYPAIESAAAHMLEAARRIDARSEERMNLLRTIGEDTATLDDIAARAENLGMNGFAPVRQRLLEQAARLREVQEANARLVLSAIRLRERWAAILAGHLSPTYSPQGQATLQDGSGFVSRTA